MSNVNANINVLVNTKQSISQLQALQQQINSLNKSVLATGSAGAAKQRQWTNSLIQGAQASGQFSTRIVPMTTAVDGFTRALDRNKLSLGQYTRYAGSQIPGMRRMFVREFDLISKVAESRVKKLATQYVALGDAAGGMGKALALTPTQLNQFSSGAAIATERARIFNQLLKQGSTSLLNWGKNTQWAGRQLMVGFTVPLMIFGALAAKTFKDLEKQAIAFKKVYGNLFTTRAETEQALSDIKELSAEFTKYGIAVKDTMALAATAAQSGAMGADLIAATTEATRLSVLGQMEAQTAMKATISMQTAFGLSAQELTEAINLLNAVENQTILSLDDVSEAIPRVASVINGFGGDVSDLSVLLVAMKEGGVGAAEGANALKNSIARIIAPTSRAIALSSELGVNLQGIVSGNQGDLVGMFQDLAIAMNNLPDQKVQELLSTIFGKFQYARIGTLLQNIADDGSQATKALDLTNEATGKLAANAERELAIVENAISTKFTASLEKFKLAIAPVGEQFLKTLTPVVEFLAKIAGAFSDLPDGVKTAMTVLIAAVGGLAPVLLMTIGLLANGIANIGKFVLFLRNMFAVVTKNSDALKSFAMKEEEALAASAALEGKVGSLTSTLLLQQKAVQTLITLYSELAASARIAATAMPSVVGGAAGRAAKGFATGGRAPGVGSTDTVPAMLTPGEFVVNKKATAKNLPLLQSINSGNNTKFFAGGGSSSPEPIRQQTKDMTWGSQEAELRAARDAVNRSSAWKTSVTGSQVSDAMNKVAAHKIEDIRGRVKMWIGKNLMPDLQAVNQYMNRVPGVAKAILEDTKKIEQIAKKTGFSTDQVRKELDGFVKKVHPSTESSRRALAEVARLDEAASKKAIKEMKPGQKDTKLTLGGQSARGGYLASMTRAILDVRNKYSGQDSYGKQASSGKLAYTGSYRTQLDDKKTTTKNPVSNEKIKQAKASVLSAREIKRNNPRLTSAQALNLARLQERRSAASGGAGGGGRSPIFMGMPDMPERQQPMTKMQKANAGVRRFGMGGGMALSMGSMIPMMGQNDQGKFLGMDAGTASMGMMGAGMATSMMGMLPAAAPIAPILAAVAAMGAVAITAKVLNDRMIESATVAADFGSNVGGTANALNTISSVFGQKTPAQRSTQMQLAFSKEEQDAAYGEFQSYLQNDSGQELLKDLKASTGTERISKLTDYTRSGIAAGVFDKETAIQFAKTVASSLNDAVTGSAVVAGITRSKQGTGSEALLGLAQERKAEVEASSKVEDDRNVKLGASIQILQDYSNALALANEEFANGTIDYKEFTVIAKEARAAQGEYTKSIKDSLLSGSGGALDPGAAASFNKEMSKILTEEQLTAMKDATESGAFDKNFGIVGTDIRGLASWEASSKSAFAGAVAGGMDADLAINTLQAIRDDAADKTSGGDLAKLYAESLSDGGGEGVGEAFALQRVAFEQTADVMAKTLGLSEDMNSEFKDLGNSFLMAGGSLGEFQTYITNLPEDMRNAQIDLMGGMTAEARQRTVNAGTRLSSLYGQEAGSQVMSGRVYQQAQEAMSGTARSRYGKKISVSSKESIEDFAMVEDTLANLREQFDQDTAIKIQIALESMQNGTEIDFDQWNQDAENVAATADMIKNSLPENYVAMFGIDFSIPETYMNLDQEDIDRLRLLGNMIQSLPDDIKSFGIDLATDENGKPKPIAEWLKDVRSADKVLRQMKSKNINVRKKAVLEMYSLVNGKEASASQVEAAEAALIEQFDQKTVRNLPADQYYKAIELKIEADQLREQAKGLDEAAASLGNVPGLEGMVSGLKSQSIALNEAAKEIDDRAADVVSAGGNPLARNDKKDSGGGGGDDPIKSFKQKILDQIKLYSDMNATMASLNDKKGSLVKTILKGKGIFDKLAGVKGLGMDPMLMQEVLDMGPEGAEKFIKKFISGNKINKEGRQILDQRAGATISATIGQNVLSARTSGQQVKAANILKKRGASEEVLQSIAGDPTKAMVLVRLQKDVDANVKGAKKAMDKFVDSEQRAIDNAEKLDNKLNAAEKAAEKLNDAFDVINLEFEIKEFETRNQLEEEFKNTNGMTVDQMNRQIDSLNDQIDAQKDLIDLEKDKIDAENKLNEIDQRKIESYNEQIDANQRIVESLSRQNELDQRRSDALRREDDIRMREADALNHELDLMSQQEEKIRSAYEERVKALEKVDSINQRILQSQQDQLSVAQAISQGDVYAAAAAAQTMASNQISFAQEQTRLALSESVDNQVGGLTTSTGLTKVQAEQQIKNLEEQSYQTSLKIRDIDDAIYQRNLAMIPLQDQIYNLKNDKILPVEDAIRDRNKTIRDYSDEIKRINEETIAPLESQKEKFTDILGQYDRKLDYAIEDLVVAGLTQKQWEKIEQDSRLYTEREGILNKMKGSWLSIVSSMAEAARLAPKLSGLGVPTVNKYAGGMIGYAAGAYVNGDGGRDSVPAMLTPGEFVMRKSAVRKYGSAMFERMNMGSFNVPKYDVSQSSQSPSISATGDTNINAPVYNSYSISVPVNQPNASADEIAYKVMTKIKNMDNASVRRINGY